MSTVTKTFTAHILATPYSINKTNMRLHRNPLSFHRVKF